MMPGVTRGYLISFGIGTHTHYVHAHFHDLHSDGNGRIDVFTNGMREISMRQLQTTEVNLNDAVLCI